MTIRQITIRAALATDVPAMVSVHYAAVRAGAVDHYSYGIIEAWSPEPDFAREQWLADVISEPDTLCSVAVWGDDTLVGFCIAHPAQSYLRALYVHPDHSGAGIGRALVEDIEDQCRKAGVEALEVKSSLNAERFYHAAGYEVIGHTTHALSNTQSMAAVHMVKRLA